MKKKSNSFRKTASPEQIYLLSQNNISVYPVFEKDNPQSLTGAWYIEVSTNGKKHRFPKKVAQNELNESIALTIIFYYNKLKEKQ